MKNVAIVILAAVSTFVLVFTVTPALCAETITYAGCGIVKNAFMAELAKKFTETHGIAVDIEGGGATRGIRDVASGKKDLGGTCRHSIDVPEEQGIRLYPVAWDAIAVIVNKDNPVESMTLSQLRDVINGGITEWSAIGVTGGPPIRFYAREGQISGVGMMARELIFHDPDKLFKTTALFRSSGPLEKAVESDTWAMALTGISSARKRNVKIVRIDDIDISKENISAGKYLLYRPLYLVARQAPSETVMKFIEFAKSDEGQEIISRQGTVNLKEGARLWQLYRMQTRKMASK